MDGMGADLEVLDGYGPGPVHEPPARRSPMPLLGGLTGLLLAGGILGTVVVTPGAGGEVLASVDPAAAVRASADATAAAGSFHLAMTSTIAFGDRKESLVGQGVVDTVGKRSRFAYTSGPLSGLEVAADGAVLYVHPPAAAAGRATKPWVKVDLGANPAVQRQLGAGQATDALAQLRSAGSVQDLGQAVDDGTKVHRYAVTVDAAKAAASNPLAQKLQASGLPPLTTQVDLDAKGRMRRITSSYAANGASVTLQVDATGYGGSEQVELPPADQVQDLGSDPSALLRVLGGVGQID